MADGRMLKRAVSQSRRLSNLKNDSHRLLYTWLIPFLDVEGRYFASPDVIKGSIVPRLKHFNEKNIQEALGDMADNELILLYQYDGEQYLQLRKFNDHQYLNKAREADSKIPPYSEDLQLQINSRVNPDDSTEVKLREVKRREVKDVHPTPDATLLFEEFWKAYPKRVNRKEALYRWKKAKLPPIEIILKKISEQKNTDEWQKDDGKYIPHPSTWINKERWLDEIDVGIIKKENTETFICCECNRKLPIIQRWGKIGSNSTCKDCAFTQQKIKEEEARE